MTEWRNDRVRGSPRYAGVFLLFAVGVAWLGWREMAAGDRVGGLLLAWLALSFAVVSAAYAVGRAGVWGKRSDGQRAGWSLLVLGPMSLLLVATRAVQLAVSREPARHEVSPGVWLGRLPTRREARALRAAGFGVVDAAAEFVARPATRGGMYLCVPTLDALAVTPRHLAQASQAIEDASGDTLVHCASGHGRSAMIVAAWLLQTGRAASPNAAEAALRSIRTGVGLSRAQQAALAEAWADRSIGGGESSRGKLHENG